MVGLAQVQRLEKDRNTNYLRNSKQEYTAYGIERRARKRNDQKTSKKKNTSNIIRVHSKKQPLENKEHTQRCVITPQFKISTVEFGAKNQ